MLKQYLLRIVLCALTGLGVAYCVGAAFTSWRYERLDLPQWQKLPRPPGHVESVVIVNPGSAYVTTTADGVYRCWTDNLESEFFWVKLKRWETIPDYVTYPYGRTDCNGSRVAFLPSTNPPPDVMICAGVIACDFGCISTYYAVDASGDVWRWYREDEQFRFYRSDLMGDAEAFEGSPLPIEAPVRCCFWPLGLVIGGLVGYAWARRHRTAHTESNGTLGSSKPPGP
jgi:hypothetical protein